jgi:hypothetical protein
MKRQHRHIGLEIDTTPWDDSEAIAAYARRFIADGYLHETLEEAADQCAADLLDASAKRRFKREVRRLRRNACR